MSEYILEMSNITKTFPGIKALDDVNFKVKKGEIHGLCGENGAGKSTLMKILSGVYPFGTYEGKIIINGKEQKFNTIKDSEKAGIAIIYQELALIKELSVGENIFLGDEPQNKGVIDWDKLYYKTYNLLNDVGLNINPYTKIKNLGIGQQQLVGIAKALSKEADILVLDEPTAALTENEVEILMGILSKLKEKGITCIYISHKLGELFRITDRITILRDGKSISTNNTGELDEGKVISLMVGRELKERFPKEEHRHGEVVLEVKNFSVYDREDRTKKIIDNVSFKVRKGEILGISGLMGAGRTELISSLFGAYESKNEGEIILEGKSIRINGPRDAINMGLALIPEDRKRYGLILEQTLLRNITLPSLETVSRNSVINFNEELTNVKRIIEMLKIKTPSAHTVVNNLSGGNQQKTVIGKWLITQPKVLFLDEPTRGIDVGAKFEVYNIMNQLVKQGVAVVMISSELPEILGMSDRIIVMYEGRITAELLREEASQEKIMYYATGGKKSELAG